MITKTPDKVTDFFARDGIKDLFLIGPAAAIVTRYNNICLVAILSQATQKAEPLAVPHQSSSTHEANVVSEGGHLHLESELFDMDHGMGLDI